MPKLSNLKEQASKIFVNGKEKLVSWSHWLKNALIVKRKTFMKPVLLEFYCRGEKFFSIHSEKISFPFKIGKAADNDLVLPAQDRTSGNYEAFLEIVKDRIVLKATPEHFFYVHGSPTVSYTLPLEDRIAIGDCELFISPTEKLKVSPCDVHRLEVLNGSQKGKIIRIEKEHFIIGSGENCDFRLQNSIVSSKHAEIRIAPSGEAWLKDHQSLNGSFVNGRRLGSQDRVLMDSDKISVACFDFRFLDKNVAHTRSHLLRNLLVVAATLVVVLIVFLLLYINIPHASQVRVAVEQLMQAEKFDLAEKKLKEMPDARDYKEHEATYFNLQNRLAIYRRTYRAWNSFRKCISTGAFSHAANYIGRLDLARETAWNWDASSVRDRMDFARECVECWRLQRELRAILYNSGEVIDPATLRPLYEMYSQKPILKDAEKAPNWMKPLYKNIQDSLVLLEKKCVQYDRINAALELLIDDKASFDNVRPLLEKEQKNAGCLRSYMLKLQVVFDQMHGVQKCIEKNIDHLTNYEFDQINHSPDFPSIENCILYPALKKKRAQLRELHSKVLNAESTISWAYQRDFRALLTPEQMNFYQTRQVELSNISDLFKRPLHEVLLDKESDYNGGAGYRHGYHLIQQTLTLDKTGYDLDVVYADEQAFPVFKAEQKLKELYALASHPDGKFLLKNQFGEDMKKISMIEEKIDQMVEYANTIAEKGPGSRFYLLIKPVVFLMKPSLVSQLEIERFRGYWKQYRQKLQDLLDQYDPLDYENSAEIRKQIFEIAIPGDPMITGVWNDVE